MLRFLLTAPLVAANTLAFGIAASLAGLLQRSGTLARRLVGAWSRSLLFLWGVKVQVHGLADLPDGAAVYAANHQSALDIPILFGHLPVDFRIVHKRSLYLIPLVGWYLWAGGHISIDRSRAFRARRSMAKASERIRRGTSLVVFPEGTRSHDETVQAFKRGSFVLALQAGAPVVPLSLAGVKRVAPRGLTRLRRGTVTLVVHPAVATVDRSVDDAAQLADEVRQVVVRGCVAALLPHPA
ncbi:MAG TPA: lysophospholipid acyltransferase family protein [Vicinamibacteria bacterium]